MMRYWEQACAKTDAMSMRERVMMFAAATFVTLYLMNTLLLQPLLAKQKSMTAQMAQQQQKTKELQAQMQALTQARNDDAHSPLRARQQQLKQELKTQAEYWQGLSGNLVEADKMAEVLEQVLNKNGKLQLIELKTLPVEPLVPQAKQAASAAGVPRLIFRHAVQITVRGSYLELLNYLAALEKLPTQMLWGEVKFAVERHPDAVLTVTLSTLSMDKTWLSV